MLHNLSDTLFPDMAAAADRSLAACLVSAAIGRTKLAEIAAVEAVVTVGMRSVARSWRRISVPRLPALSLQTVFCHAAPKVSFTRPGTAGTGCCELADILLVIDDLSASAPEERRRAVLVQAKLHDVPGCIRLNGGNDRVQFELLSEWPAFTFEATFYKCHARELTLGPVPWSCSGEYAGIDQPPPGAWTQYLITRPQFASTPPLHGATSLGSLLAGMLAGRAGYGRAAIPFGRDPWSETVQELLDVTFSRPIRGSQPNSKRGRSHLLNFDRNASAPEPWLARSGAVGGSPMSPEYEGEEWPDGAISVVRFILGEG